MKNNSKHYIWLLPIILIPGLPILLNFLVFKPTSHYSVGTLHDWMSFFGSYLGATISASVAFIILSIQRKDAKQNYEKIRRDDRRQYLLNRRKAGLDEAIKNQWRNKYNQQFQQHQLLYRQEVQWLRDLQKALSNYISAYRDIEIIDIINSIQKSSFESIQQKIKIIKDSLALANTSLDLVIVENSKTMIIDIYQKELSEMYTHYTSIIDEIEQLAFIYYSKTPISNKVSDNLNNLIVKSGIDTKSMDYNQFSELAQQTIKPLKEINERIRELSLSFIKDERDLIDTLLRDNEKMQSNRL